MAPTRYSLHYEDYSEHMMSRFGKLLQMQSLVDMTLMCNSHTLRVHKVVLAACSVYFQEVLQKQIGEPLIILKMRFCVLKCLVEFMYCGKTQCAEDNLDELMSAAQFLKIKGLAKVTKEDLGIMQTSELPPFTPPVVISRPPNAHATFEPPLPPPPPLRPQHKERLLEPQPPPLPVSTAKNIGDNLNRSADEETVVRIPFDIEKGGSAGLLMGPSGTPYPDGPGPRSKGRKSRAKGASRMSAAAWDNSALGRAAGRALMRREHDSRRAIHHLKNLQSRHMQDYMSMEQVSLSHAVNSICGPETPPYLNMESDIYLDQPPRLDTPLSYKEPTVTVTSTFTTATSSNVLQTEASNSGATAMSQYVNALKNAGLPTDLPILFESGDGSYINVNEQVLLDMVQSSEIQYEVIEQPNIIEKVADPTEIKSIDDLSKSIERGEMMMGYNTTYDKTDHRYAHNDSTISGLSSMLPDNMESFGEQHNFVVLDQPLQEATTMDTVNTNDFCDMNFFTKSMSDDVKKYYREPLSASTMDPNFSMPLLDEKHGNENQQYAEDLRRNVCYDFGLQSNDFKEDALDCLMAPTPKRDDEDQLVARAQEKNKIIQDLMNIEKEISQQSIQEETDFAANIKDFVVYKQEDKSKDATYSSELNEWDNMDMTQGERDETSAAVHSIEGEEISRDYNDSVMDLTDNTKNIQLDSEDYDKDNVDYDRGHVDYARGNVDYEKAIEDYGKDFDKENERPNIDVGDMIRNEKSPNIGVGRMIRHHGRPFIQFDNMIKHETSPTIHVKNIDECVGDSIRDNASPIIDVMVRNDIPFAVGLLPLKETSNENEDAVLKRKYATEDFIDDDDAKCLKRKVKYKKL